MNNLETQIERGTAKLVAAGKYKQTNLLIEMYPEALEHIRELDLTPKQLEEMFQLVVDLDECLWLVEQLSRGSSDFEAGGYRFIHEGDILSILAEELSNDTYILGSFNASFLARHTGLPLKVIEALQKADVYEALGEACLPHIEDIAQGYADADGYGHHFAHYDGSEHCMGEYYAFKVI